MKKEKSNMISAEVILKSKSGRSLAHPDKEITAVNIEEYTPSPDTIEMATQILEGYGFMVMPSEVTLTILGQPLQFEKVFKVKLTLNTNEKTSAIIVLADRDLGIPNSLKEYVEKIVFPEPPEFFP